MVVRDRAAHLFSIFFLYRNFPKSILSSFIQHSTNVYFAYLHVSYFSWICNTMRNPNCETIRNTYSYTDPMLRQVV